MEEGLFLGGIPPGGRNLFSLSELPDPDSAQREAMSEPKSYRLQARSIENVKTTALLGFEKNARRHSEEQLEQIAASIREFGFTNPILIDSRNGIVAGHGRVAAAQKLGLEEVPCIRLGELSERQKRAYILADNKIALNSDWNETLLAMELQKLRDEEFDIALTGFSDAELDALLSDLAPQAEDDDEEGEVPQAIQLEPPREYAVVMCDNLEEWEALKVALNLVPVRRGGYKKGSPFESVGTQRVVKAADVLKKFSENAHSNSL